MCHASVLRWFPKALTTADVADRRVLEVGSYDVNGSVRPLVEALGPASYIGVDQTAGPRVDEVVDCTGLVGRFGRDAFDVVVSTEMLEHAREWRGCLWAMAEVLAPGGLLILTTRSPGFPFHPFPEDCWRFTRLVMAEALTSAGFGPYEVCDDPEAPGVFVRARRSEPWRPDRAALDRVEAEPAPCA
jgi:SAM-dependent methyltransferase